MSATATDTRAARLPAGPLTDKGLAVAYTFRLRQAVELLPSDEAVSLLAELRELVSFYARPRPRPAA